MSNENTFEETGVELTSHFSTTRGFDFSIPPSMQEARGEKDGCLHKIKILTMLRNKTRYTQAPIHGKDYYIPPIYAQEYANALDDEFVYATARYVFLQLWLAGD